MPCRLSNSFQLLSICKRIAHALSQGDIAVMNRVVGDELQLLHIRLAILGKILFIYEDVYYLCHDVMLNVRPLKS